MDRFRLSSLLFLYAAECASLVLSNMPRTNAIDQGTPQLIQPANLIQPQNHTLQSPGGNYHDIGSNLSVYLTVGDPSPAQPLTELLLLAKEQVHDRAAQFGSTTTVSYRKKQSDLRTTTHAGLVYTIQPARYTARGRPGLDWGEWDIATTWLYEYFRNMPDHYLCTFLVFRMWEFNLAFGEIKPLETLATVDAVRSSVATLVAQPVVPG